MKKVRDHQFLFRDESKAIINTDDIGLKKAKERKRKLSQQKNQTEKNSEAISMLEGKLNHIQNIMETILSKLE